MGTVFIAAACYDAPPQPTPTGERQHDSPSAILSQTSIETTLNHVPAPPTILVTARSHEERTTRAAEAIRLYFESMHTNRKRYN